MKSLVDWVAKTPVEKKLVLGVLHRSGHKNFEEATEAQIQAYNNAKKNQANARMSRRQSNRSKVSNTSSMLTVPRMSILRHLSGLPHQESSSSQNMTPFRSNKEVRFSRRSGSMHLKIDSKNAHFDESSSSDHAAYKKQKRRQSLRK